MSVSPIPAADSGRQAFAYRAARADGQVESGTLESHSREAVSTALVARGLFPITIEHRLTTTVVRRRSIPAGDVALGLRMLATLLDSGMPVSRALAALDDLVPPTWHRALPHVRDGVRSGKTVAASLKEAPCTVPAIVIGILQAGEAGSGLAAAVRLASELMESSAKSRAAVRAALAYPLILAAASTASTALLVLVVIPKFAGILADLGQQLPASTRFVLEASSALRAAALPMLVFAVSLVLLGRWWTATAVGAERWQSCLLKLPLIGEVRAASASASLSGSLSALIDSGVPLATALAAAADAVGNVAITARLHSAREWILRGGGIASALEAARAATPTTIRLARAGEQSGALASMLAHASRIERERAEAQLKAAIRLLEPALIMAFGLLVSLIAAALLQAVYSVRPT